MGLASRYGKPPKLREEEVPLKENPPEAMLGLNHVAWLLTQPKQGLRSSATWSWGKVQEEIRPPPPPWGGVGVGVGVDVGVGVGVLVGVGEDVGVGVGVSVGEGVGVGVSVGVSIGVGVGVGTPSFKNHGVAVESDLKNSMSISATAWLPAVVGCTQSLSKFVIGQIRPSRRGFIPSIQRYGPQEK